MDFCGSILTGIVSGVISGLYTGFILYKIAVFLEEKKALITQFAACDFITIHNCSTLTIPRKVYTNLTNILNNLERLGHTKASTQLSKLLDELLAYEDGIKYEEDLLTLNSNRLHRLTEDFLTELKPDFLTITTSKAIAKKVRFALNYFKKCTF